MSKGIAVTLWWLLQLQPGLYLAKMKASDDLILMSLLGLFGAAKWLVISLEMVPPSCKRFGYSGNTRSTCRLSQYYICNSIVNSS